MLQLRCLYWVSARARQSWSGWKIQKEQKRFCSFISHYMLHYSYHMSESRCCQPSACSSPSDVLSHADLVPREVAEAWLKYLREELPTVAFKCSTQKQASNLGQRHLPKASSADTALQGSECLGANTLLHLLKNYTRNSDTKTAITVGEGAFTCPCPPPSIAIFPCTNICLECRNRRRTQLAYAGKRFHCCYYCYCYCYSHCYCVKLAVLSHRNCGLLLQSLCFSVEHM